MLSPLPARIRRQRSWRWKKAGHVARLPTARRKDHSSTIKVSGNGSDVALGRELTFDEGPSKSGEVVTEKESNEIGDDCPFVTDPRQSEPLGWRLDEAEN